MRRLFHWPQTLAIAAILLPAAALAQARGQWHLVGSDQRHDNWQATESKLSPQSVQSNFKLLWKLKLGEDRAPQSFSEMLFTPSMITSHGFKDMGVWADSDTLYAVDYALGTIFWKKKFTIAAAHGCAPEKMQLLMEPPHVIHFGAKSTGTAKAAPAPPPPPVNQRWIGAPTQGGGFGLKGIYAVTSDGILHEQNLANGSDFAPSVLLLPGASDTISALNMDEKVLYAETRGGCGHDGNTLWSIDLNSSAHSSNNSPIDNAGLLDRTGVAIGGDGTVYAATSASRKDMSPPSRLRNVTAFSAKDLKIQDWYASVQPEKTTELNLSPIVLRYKDRELVAAAGGGGSIVLLDAKSLGGDDHHTPLAQSAKIANATRPEAWEALASWREQDGTTWLLASISGPVEPSVQFANTNGPAEHGSIIAFKIAESNGQLVLAPQWISRDLRSPAPPVIANGVVFSLSGGDAGTHAVLYALDAQTGKELYSSGAAITAPSHLAGVSVGDGHVFFTTQDNTLYSFGIPMEH